MYIFSEVPLKLFIGGDLKRIIYYGSIILLFLGIGFANICSAEGTLPVEPGSQPPAVVQVEDSKPLNEVMKHDKTLSPVHVFANLFTLIIIMLVLAWLYNKYGKNTLAKVLSSKNLNKNSINILSTAPIGQNKYLHIVEVNGEKILIGATNSNISFLKEVKSDISQEKVVSDE